MMSWIDTTILIIIGLSLITGGIRGFLKEVLSLVVWILAFWLAFKYASNLGDWLTPYFKGENVRYLIGFASIFFGTLVAGGLFNLLLGLLLKHSGLGTMDRLLGMVFGIARGILIVAICIVAVDITSLPHETYRKDSMLYAKFDPLVHHLQKYVPDLIKHIQVYDKKEGKELAMDTNDVMKFNSKSEFALK